MNSIVISKRIFICLLALCIVLTGRLYVVAEQTAFSGDFQASGRTADRIIREDSRTVFVNKGETVQLEYTLVSNSGNTDFSDEVISWSISADAGAFTLTDKGEITGYQENKEAFVEATLKNGRGTYFVVVCQPEITEIDFVEDANYELSADTRILLNHRDYLAVSRESYADRREDEFDYESDNTDAFIVDDYGYLEAVGEGTAVITVKDRRHPEISTSHEFVCGSASAPSGIRILSKHPSELCAGFMYVPLEICYEPGYADGDTTWTSSDANVISISETTPTKCFFNVLQKGTAIITAVSQNNPDLSAQFSFTVTDNVPSEDSYRFSFEVSEVITEVIDGVTYDNSYVADDTGLIVLRKGKQYITWTIASGDMVYPDIVDVRNIAKATGLMNVYGSGGLTDSSWDFMMVFEPVKTGTAAMTIGPKSYTVLVVSDSNPYLFLEDTNINAGDTARIQVYTDHFQQAVTWDSSKKSVATVDENGVITGIKPGYSTISATDKNGKKGTKKVRVLFTDVPASGIYYSNAVYWAVDKGITGGYKDDDGIVREFRPQNNCTREAVVTFLWRLAGKPEPKSMESPFPDVQDSGKYYYKAVLWAVEKGITKGYDDGTFKPDETCTREAIVTFLWRYAGKPKPKSKTNPFNDVTASDYYYKAAIWANENGIAKGYTSGEYAGGFGPKLDCLREHVVTFLYRYNNKFGTK